MACTFTIEKIDRDTDPTCVVVEGHPDCGHFLAGGSISLATVSGVAVRVPIKAVEELGEGRFRLVLQCPEGDGSRLVRTLGYETAFSHA